MPSSESADFEAAGSSEQPDRELPAAEFAFTNSPPSPVALPGPLAEPSFLHPSSVVFEALSKIRQYIVPAIIGLAGAARGSYWGAVFAIVFFVFSVLATLLRYFTLRYCIRGDDFIVTEGLLFRRVRSVPIRRIQNMDLVQNPLHRIFGVAEVNVETASGTKPEATLRVLTHRQIDELRQAIFGKQASTEALSPPDDESVAPDAVNKADPLQAEQVKVSSAAGSLLYAIPTRELILAGLASNRGLVLVGVVAGFFFQGDFDQRISFDFLDGYLPSGREPLELALYGLIGFALLMLVLRILGIAWYIQRFYGYQLRLVGEDLRISCGLFTKVSATVPRKRVHFISVHRSFIMRWFGLAAIRIETAGGAGTDKENAASTVSRRWFMPVVSEKQVDRILEQLRPNMQWQETKQEIQWQGVSPLTGKRLRRLALVASLIIVGVGLAITRPWGWAPGAVMLPLLILLIQKKCKSKRYATTDWGVAYQSGVLTRKVSLTFYDRIQTLKVNQSPFDRRWHMATLSIDTAAAGPAEHTVDVGYLDEAFALAEFARLQESAARHRPSWA